MQAHYKITITMHMLNLSSFVTHRPHVCQIKLAKAEYKLHTKLSLMPLKEQNLKKKNMKN
jgi:hypothetical protein